MSVPPDQFVRQALGEIGASGNPTFEWKLTSSSLIDQVKLVIQDKVLPVIFVPGIMGSNLMDLEGNPVWRLDDGLFGVPWQLAFGIAPKGPAGRQRLMHPEKTRVDPGGKVPSKASGTITGKKKKARKSIFRDQRFWGEVGSASYH